MSVLEQFHRVAGVQLQQILDTQKEALDSAAEWLSEVLISDRWLYAFGTGHSHILAEEIFYRAGGLARAIPMLDERLMLHKEAAEATYLERSEGYAKTIADRYAWNRGDLLLVASNSGRNAVPVEMAMLGRERGLHVVAITNKAHSREWPSRHSSGKRLMEVAELVIDTCGVSGDVALQLSHYPHPFASTSSLAGIFIIQSLVARAIERAVEKGGCPEVFISSNTTGDNHNERLLAQAKRLNPHL